MALIDTRSHDEQTEQPRSLDGSAAVLENRLRFLGRHPWLWACAGWVALGAYYGIRNVISAWSRGRPVDWPRDFWYEVIYWATWAVVMPVVLAFARHARRRLTPGRAIGAIAVFGLLVTPIQGALEAIIAISIDRFIVGDTPEQIADRLPVIVRAVALGCFSGYVTFWIILGVDSALAYYMAYKRREVAAVALERRLAESTLQNLRAQLQPHFLFNTLNTVSVLMMRDAPAARQMLVRLGELLRFTLRSSGVHEITLQEELEYVRHYLAIEQVRFSDRLRVDIQVPPSALDARVPSMLLQPLVENAIRHGISTRSTAGYLSIRVTEALDQLEIRVQDDGPGFPESDTTGGLGLANTRARLSQLYGAHQSLTTSNASGGGAVITVVLPYRRTI